MRPSVHVNESGSFSTGLRVLTIKNLARVGLSTEDMGFGWDCLGVRRAGLPQVRVQRTIEFPIGGSVLESISEIC